MFSVWDVLTALSLADRPAALWAVMETTGSSDPTTWLVNYGVAGTFIALLATGQFRTKWEVNGLKEHITQLQADLVNKEKTIESKDKLVEAFQLQLTGHTLPALARSASILESIPTSEATAIEELRRSQAQAIDLIERLERLAKGSDGEK